MNYNKQLPSDVFNLTPQRKVLVRPTMGNGRSPTVTPVTMGVDKPISRRHLTPPPSPTMHQAERFLTLSTSPAFMEPFMTPGTQPSRTLSRDLSQPTITEKMTTSSLGFLQCDAETRAVRCWCEGAHELVKRTNWRGDFKYGWACDGCCRLIEPRPRKRGRTQKDESEGREEEDPWQCISCDQHFCTVCLDVTRTDPRYLSRVLGRCTDCHQEFILSKDITHTCEKVLDPDTTALSHVATDSNAPFSTQDDLVSPSLCSQEVALDLNQCPSAYNDYTSPHDSYLPQQPTSLSNGFGSDSCECIPRQRFGNDVDHRHAVTSPYTLGTPSTRGGCDAQFSNAVLPLTRKPIMQTPLKRPEFAQESPMLETSRSGLRLLKALQQSQLSPSGLDQSPPSYFPYNEATWIDAPSFLFKNSAWVVTILGIPPKMRKVDVCEWLHLRPEQLQMYMSSVIVLDADNGTVLQLLPNDNDLDHICDIYPVWVYSCMTRRDAWILEHVQNAKVQKDGENICLRIQLHRKVFPT